MLSFQDTCEVYYDTPKLEYTDANIYGFYEKQNGTINGKNWYRRNAKTIWWEWYNSTLFLDGYGMWFLGNMTKNSNSSVLFFNAYTDIVDNGTDLQSVNWRLATAETKNVDSWNYAGKKLKIRCKYQQRRKYQFQNSANIIYYLDCNRRYITILRLPFFTFQEYVIV